MKKLISLITLIAVLFTAAGCIPVERGNNKSDPTSSGSPAISSTTPAGQEQKLNVELLNDLGRSYSHLKEKYGNPVKAFIEGGGTIYVFNNGFEFGFSLEENQDYSKIPVDENGNWILKYVPIPSEQNKCIVIRLDSVKKLFLILTENIKDVDIEKIYGVKHKSTTQDLDYYYPNYFSVFTFEDFTIYIQTKQKGLIEPNSILTIKFGL